jgi:DNA-binding YbaB/EbfC family protein
MKLPRGFGGQGFASALQQAQAAMARARTLESELQNERIRVDKGPVKAIFDGTGKLVQISIDRSVIVPDDKEELEDLIVSAVRDGFETATQLRNEKVQEIMPNIPGL